MGRSKKHAAPGATVPVTDKAALQNQLLEVKAQLGRLHLEGDAEKIGTSMQIAGLTQQMWSLQSLLTTNTDEALACSRQAAAWGEQHVRAAKALSTDLLRDLWAKAQLMERHQSQLKGLK